MEIVIRMDDGHNVSVKSVETFASVQDALKEVSRIVGDKTKSVYITNMADVGVQS